ncbi:MAG TPA: heavy metal-binding domain-containing protein [Solirubrobacteraceae bacterium]|nr:heavy metal-binding domain-containing protein [Solirubrobacteraceae bacterium]
MSAAAAYTSDLSVGDFALCHQLGLEPLSQVMGSSIYQVGYESGQWPSAWGGGMTYELSALSDAWNEVRELALGRLAQEATQAGADAVIGVDVRSGTHDFAEGGVEQVVIGTAVRHTRERDRDRAKGAAPVLTELSVADYVKLLQAGVEPLGIVAWSSVFFVFPSSEVQAVGGLAGRLMYPENQELVGYTQGVYEARETVLARMTEQAERLGASGVIGTRIAHGIATRDVRAGGFTQTGLVVTFHAIGTAIAGSAEADPHPPQTAIDLTT